MTVSLIRSILKWAVVALTAGVLLAMLALYFAHHKVVTSGEFRGLKIGETKEEVFLRLVDKPNVSAVSAMVTEYLSITRANTDDLRKLADHEAFVVFAHKTHVRVYVTDGYISDISTSDAGWEMESVAVGDPIDAAFPVIEKFLLNEPNSRVFTTIQDRGNVSVEKGVSIIDNPEFDWLRQYDHWGFSENVGYTYTNLYFTDAHLTKIVYKNYFVG